MKLELAWILALVPSLAAQGAHDGTAPVGAPAPPDPTLIMSAAEADPGVPRGVIVNQPGAFQGFTLFAPLNSRTVYLIDMTGEAVHTWPTDSAPGAWVYLLDDGTLLRCGREDTNPRFKGGGIGGRIQELAPDGTILWQASIAGENRWQHHDVEPLPNGNVLVIAWERISRAEAIAHGRDPGQVGEPGLWPDVVLELRPTPPEGAEIVWEWHAWDHVVQDVDPALAGYGAIAAHPGRIDVNAYRRGDEQEKTEEERRAQAELEAQMRALGYAGGGDDEEGAGDAPAGPWEKDGDWLHTNGVDYLPDLDLIVLSSPHLSEVWIIDHSTTTAEAASDRGGRRGHGGELLWRWGNPQNHGAGTEADRRLFEQHDPTFLSGTANELRLLVLNNGSGRPDGKYTTVDELMLPYDPERGFASEPGRACGPAAPAWSYSDRDGFFAAFVSGAQRLPNGNTLVCSGPAGRLFEVTPEGRIVWDFRNPHGGEVDPPEHAGRAPPLALFRGTRLPPDHPGVRRLTR